MTLQQGLAGDLFLFVSLAAFTCCVYLATEFLKTWHAKSAELDQVLAADKRRHPAGKALAQPPTETVYDQDLDGTDLSTWDQELRS